MRSASASIKQRALALRRLELSIRFERPLPKGRLGRFGRDPAGGDPLIPASGVHDFRKNPWGYSPAYSGVTFSGLSARYSSHAFLTPGRLFHPSGSTDGSL
jgi:hypothetical protein